MDKYIGFDIDCKKTVACAAIPQDVVLWRIFVGLMVCISGVTVILRFWNFPETFSAVI